MKAPSIKGNGWAEVNWIFSFVRRFVPKEGNGSAGSWQLPWRQRFQGHAAEGTQGSPEEPQLQEKPSADAQAGAGSSALHGKVNTKPEIISEEEEETFSYWKATIKSNLASKENSVFGRVFWCILF